MGYDLKSRWKNNEGLYIGAFIWSWMLSEGVGLILGSMDGRSPGTYTFIPRNGLDPHSNEGFRVTADEARAMSKAARALVSGYKFIEKQWNELTDEQRERDYKHNETSTVFKYKTPIRNDFLQKAIEFADWAEKSGGFEIW